MALSKMKIAFILLFGLQLTGCSWVKLTSAGKNVYISNAAAIASCKKLGSTTVALQGAMPGIKPKQKTVEKELGTLARNSGASMGGNTIVPTSEIKNGEKSFDVYNCASI
ncbi:MAG: DUF4156 domain-containing protein [Gammaproteobacteria bacterium]|nr:DUF4156 domain-containing protein [Gammaproteobacteria bacterium]